MKVAFERLEMQTLLVQHMQSKQTNKQKKKSFCCLVQTPAILQATH